jgi:hypothetical protein
MKDLSKKMIYTGDEPREIPGFGVYKPGDEVEYDEILHGTGLFKIKSRKEGDS